MRGRSEVCAPKKTKQNAPVMLVGFCGRRRDGFTACALALSSRPSAFDDHGRSDSLKDYHTDFLPRFAAAFISGNESRETTSVLYCSNTQYSICGHFDVSAQILTLLFSLMMDAQYAKSYRAKVGRSATDFCPIAFAHWVWTGMVFSSWFRRSEECLLAHGRGTEEAFDKKTDWWTLSALNANIHGRRDGVIGLKRSAWAGRTLFVQTRSLWSQEQFIVRHAVCLTRTLFQRTLPSFSSLCLFALFHQKSHRWARSLCSKVYHRVLKTPVFEARISFQLGWPLPFRSFRTDSYIWAVLSGGLQGLKSQCRALFLVVHMAEKRFTICSCIPKVLMLTPPLQTTHKRKRHRFSWAEAHENICVLVALLIICVLFCRHNFQQCEVCYSFRDISDFFGRHGRG